MDKLLLMFHQLVEILNDLAVRGIFRIFVPIIPNYDEKIQL